jgi:hypothetical protein
MAIAFEVDQEPVQHCPLVNLRTSKFDGDHLKTVTYLHHHSHHVGFIGNIVEIITAFSPNPNLRS